MKTAGFVIILLLIFSSCNNSEKKKKVEPLSDEMIIRDMKIEAPSTKAGNLRHGKAVYMRYCMTCHMRNGSGVSEIQPPLNDPNLISNNKQLINIVLNGISGEIKVNGKEYNNIMPSHSHLSNQEIADVLTYIRNNFGNNFGPVSPAEVKAERN